MLLFDTIFLEVAADKQIDIVVKHNLRERESTSAWIHNDLALEDFLQRMWSDPGKSVDGGESIEQLQRRNILEINRILKAYEGSALAPIINYYKPEFCGDDFMKFIRVMPYIMKMVFDKNECIEMEEVPASSPADVSR